MDTNVEGAVCSRSRLTHRWLPLAIAMMLFLVASGPHIRRSIDPLRFTDDARQQISPFLRFYEPDLLLNDPVVDYLLKCLPIGYWAVYRFSAPILDPRVASKIIPYLLLGVVLAGVWIACRTISGNEAAWLGVFIVLAMGSPLEGMSGGLPRSFAMALFAAGTAALLTRKPWWLAVTAIAGAAIYPMLGVLLGIVVAIYAFVWPGLRLPGEGRRRWTAAIVLTMVTAAGCLLMLAPPLYGVAEYGGGVGPDKYDVYPEAGPAGRFTEISPAETPWFPISLFQSVTQFLTPAGVPEFPAGWTWVLVAPIFVAGGAVVMVRRPRSRDLLVLIAAIGVIHTAAKLVFPLLYWPGRYLIGTIPVLVVIVAATATGELAGWIARTERGQRLNRLVVVVLVLPLLLALAAAPGKERRINKNLNNRKAFLEFVATLPPDSLLAGWPKGDMESVRLVCARKVLVEFETHLVFHRRYMDLMRPRAALSIQATLSHSDEALRRLHDEFGVTHFVHSPGFAEKKPYYFEPFNEVIRETNEARGDQPYGAERLAETAAVYRGDRNVVIDLRKAFAD